MFYFSDVIASLHNNQSEIPFYVKVDELSSSSPPILRVKHDTQLNK